MAWLGLYRQYRPFPPAQALPTMPALRDTAVYAPSVDAVTKRRNVGGHARQGRKAYIEQLRTSRSPRTVGYTPPRRVQSSTPGHKLDSYWAIFQSEMVLAMSPTPNAGEVSAAKKVANFVTSSACALAAKMMSLLCSCTCCARK